MKVKLSIPKFGMWLAIFIIAYLNITAMLPEGVAANPIISLIMLLIAGIGLFLLFARPLPLKSVSLMLLLYYLYIVTLSIGNGYFKVFMQEPTMVFTCAFWVFIFWLFVECGRQQNIKHETFSNVFFILTIVCFVLFCRFYSLNQIQDDRLSALNIVYYLIFMLPIVLMSKNKKIVGIGIALNILAVVLSSKRGALVIVLIALFVWIRTDLSGRFDTKKLSKVLFYVVLAIVALIAITALVDELGLNIFERMESFLSGEDSSGSGRITIWTDYWNQMKRDSIWHDFFGRGYNATKLNADLKPLGLSWAHNDFLQVLFDYGIIGLVIFCIIVGKLFKIASEMKKFQYCYYRQFFVSLFIFLLCCIYSMVTIYPQWFLSMAAFWGFVIGDFERERMACK